MRAVVVVVVFVGCLWAIDTFVLDGMLTQMTLSEGSYLAQKAKYEIWKIRFHSG